MLSRDAARQDFAPLKRQPVGAQWAAADARNSLAALRACRSSRRRHANLAANCLTCVCLPRHVSARLAACSPSLLTLIESSERRKKP